METHWGQEGTFTEVGYFHATCECRDSTNGPMARRQSWMIPGAIEAAGREGGSVRNVGRGLRQWRALKSDGLTA